MHVKDYCCRSFSLKFVLSLALPLLASSHAQADISEALGRMVADGKISLGFRYRLEEVQQENAIEDATASTLRTRLSLQSATVNHFSILIEADNVLALGPEDYDSFQLDRYRGTHSVVADPVGTEINQALVRYEFTHATAVAGRQRINHANQRFVGGVGWRQNEQTFDALSYRWAQPGISVDYSYLWNVNRIFAGSRPSVQAEDFASDSHTAQTTWINPWGTLLGFVYALDFANAAAASSLSYGITYSGKFDPFTVTAGYARQQDYGANPLAYNSDYLLLEAAVPISGFTVLLGYEMLGSDDGLAGFSTPLATLHKFQGFADIFLSTPANGVEDIYGTLSLVVGSWSIGASWHDFSANEGSAHYGSEIDLTAAYRITSAIGAELKLARYNSDSFAVDTEKFWLTLNLAF